MLRTPDTEAAAAIHPLKSKKAKARINWGGRLLCLQLGRGNAFSASPSQALNITPQSFISQRRSHLEWDRTAPSSTILGPTEYLILKRWTCGGWSLGFGVKKTWIKILALLQAMWHSQVRWSKPSCSNCRDYAWQNARDQWTLNSCRLLHRCAKLTRSSGCSFLKTTVTDTEVSPGP